MTDPTMPAWTEGLEPLGGKDDPVPRAKVFRPAAVALAIIAGLGASAYGAVIVVSGGSSSAPKSAQTSTASRSSTATAPTSPPRGSSTGTAPTSPFRGSITGEGSPAASRTVASVGSKSFTLKTTSGQTLTVDVSSTTTYRDFGVTSPSFATLKVSEHVVVFGTASSGAVTAQSVVIGAVREGFGHEFGGGIGETPGVAGSTGSAV
jgi:hypothetical protein